MRHPALSGTLCLQGSYEITDWVVREQRVRFVLALLALPLIVWRGLQEENSTMSDESSSHDEKYGQAMEFYALICRLISAASDLLARYEDGTISEEDKRDLERLWFLGDAIEEWQLDAPDAVVAPTDREDVDRIIDNVFQGPPAWVPGTIPDDMLESLYSCRNARIPDYDRDSCRRITVSFYNGNRCFADILFYFDAPLAAAGLGMYLCKHEGQWKVCDAREWRS